MPLILQEQYQAAFKRLVEVMEQVRKNTQSSDTQKMRAKVVGSRVWLEAELVKAKSLHEVETNPTDKAGYAAKVQKITTLLNKTDCDIRVESEAGVIEKEAFARAYDEYQRALVPGIPFDPPKPESYYQPQCPADYPHDFDLSFQNKLAQPRSNFDAYIDEHNKMIFMNATHKRDFEDFIHRDTIKTYNILEQVQKEKYEYLEASNFANLLKSYGKPIKMGKHFDLETAQALNLLLNHPDYRVRRDSVENHVGRIYVKGFKKGDPKFFEARRVFFKAMVDEINLQVQQDLKKNALKKTDELLGYLDGLQKSLLCDDENDSLSDWLEEAGAVKQRRQAIEQDLASVSLLQIDQFNGKLEQLKIRGQGLYDKVESVRIAAEVKEAREAREKKLQAVDPNPNNSKKAHPKIPKKKHVVQDKRPKSKARTEEDIDAILAEQEMKNKSIIHAEQNHDLGCVHELICLLDEHQDALEKAGKKITIDEQMLKSLHKNVDKKTPKEQEAIADKIEMFRPLLKGRLDLQLLSQIEMIHSLLAVGVKAKDGEKSKYEALCFNLPSNAKAFVPTPEEGVSVMKAHLKVWRQYLTALNNEKYSGVRKSKILDIEVYIQSLNRKPAYPIIVKHDEYSDTLAEGGSHFNKMKAADNMIACNKDSAAFMKLSNLFKAFLIAIKKANNQGGTDPLHILLQDPENVLQHSFAPNGPADTDRLAQLRNYLSDWTVYFEGRDVTMTAALTTATSLAKRYKESLDKLFGQLSLDAHPLFVFYHDNANSLFNILSLGDARAAQLFSLYKEIMETLVDQFESDEIKLIEKIVCQRLKDKNILTPDEVLSIKDYFHMPSPRKREVVSDETVVKSMMIMPRFDAVKSDPAAIMKLKKLMDVMKDYRKHQTATQHDIASQYIVRIYDIFAPSDEYTLPRVSQILTYLDLMSHYVKANMGQLPDYLTEGFDLLGRITTEVKKFFPDGIIKHPLYAFYSENAVALKAFLELNPGEYVANDLFSKFTKIQVPLLRALSPTLYVQMHALMTLALLDNKLYTDEELKQVLALNPGADEQADFRAAQSPVRSMPISRFEIKPVKALYDYWIVQFNKTFIIQKKTKNKFSPSWVAAYPKFDKNFFEYAQSKGASPAEAAQAFYLALCDVHTKFDELDGMVDLYNKIIFEKFKATSYQELLRFGDPSFPQTDSAYLINFCTALLNNVPECGHNPFYVDWESAFFKNNPQLKLATLYKLIQVQFHAGLYIQDFNHKRVSEEDDPGDAFEVIEKHRAQLNRLMKLACSFEGLLMMKGLLDLSPEQRQGTRKPVFHSRNNGKVKAQAKIPDPQTGATAEELSLIGDFYKTTVEL